VARHPRLIPPIGVVVQDESADAEGELAGGTRREPHLALPRLGLDPAGQLAFGARKTRTSPPSDRTAPTTRFWPGSFAPLVLDSMKAIPLPGATSGRIARSASRSSVLTVNAPTFVTTPSVPPPNIDWVATRS
jgi:hypothetical protein